MTAARRADGGRGDGARRVERRTLSGEVESPLKGDLPRRGSFKMLKVERGAKLVEAKCDPYRLPLRLASGIFSLKHESSIFRSFISPCRWF